MQTLLAILLVLAAAAYLGRRIWRTVRAGRGEASGGGCGGCASGGGAAPMPLDQGRARH